MISYVYGRACHDAANMMIHLDDTTTSIIPGYFQFRRRWLRLKLSSFGCLSDGIKGEIVLSPSSE